MMSVTPQAACRARQRRRQRRIHQRERRPVQIGVQAALGQRGLVGQIPPSRSSRCPPPGSSVPRPPAVVFVKLRLARSRMSQISVSGFAAPCAAAFAVSMTLPPPTAKIRSAPNAIASPYGLAGQPQPGIRLHAADRRKCESRAPVSSASTRSSRPLFFALMPAVDNEHALRAAAALTASGSFSRLPAPKITLRRRIKFKSMHHLASPRYHFSLYHVRCSR